MRAASVAGAADVADLASPEAAWLHKCDLLMDRTPSRVQNDAVKHSLSQLEKRVDALHEQLSAVATVQGSLKGLFEELGALRTHVDTVNTQLWARVSGLEVVRQQSQELDRAIQDLDQWIHREADAIHVQQKRQAADFTRLECAVSELASVRPRGDHVEVEQSNVILEKDESAILWQEATDERLSCMERVSAQLLEDRADVKVLRDLQCRLSSEIEEGSARQRAVGERLDSLEGLFAELREHDHVHRDSLAALQDMHYLTMSRIEAGSTRQRTADERLDYLESVGAELLEVADGLLSQALLRDQHYLAAARARGVQDSVIL